MSHGLQSDDKILGKANKILLMGNPNVGKSVFFTELTGIAAVSSNYAGTTVSFMEGRLAIGATDYALIDVPGTYSLQATSEAEAVATRFMESGAAAVICVLDASNLERNLHLALELRPFGIPIIYVLNLTDIASRQGISINAKLLAQDLGAPVIEAVAVKKQGVAEIKNQLAAILQNPPGKCTKTACGYCKSCPHGDSGDIWLAARDIARRVTTKNPANPGFLDRLGDAMLRPMPGLPIAALVLVLLVGVVVFGGRGLRMPLIILTDGLIVPFFQNAIANIFVFFNADGRFAEILQNVLIGEFGIFVISFQWIIALIFPYVFSFYIGITFLEDSGYLPRVSVLFDNIMRKLGVQGGSLIHVFLALGCAIPAILGSRTATTKKERMMIATIICFAIPCISQIGALVALTSEFSWWMPFLMIFFAILLFASTALIAGKIIRGKVDPMILEIPNLLMPEPKAYFRKLAIRMKHFLKDAEVPMLGAVFLAALLAGTGVLGAIANQPQVQAVVSGWLGMPEEAVVSLILGIVRREMSVAPLLMLNLSHLQAFVAGVVSLMYLPCLSVFGVLAKEFKIRFAVIIFVGTVTTAILVGGIINQIGQLIF
ncbi:MAG: ferrous iron transporter B [Defluviitaleaceae bacterium]|nr:ferrous iron transporter B [Defluviitaleaceae bacterium]